MDDAVLLGTAQTLVGIVSAPPEPRHPSLPAVLLLNAGLLHRVGPNAIHVQMARRLAAEGFPVLRFDYSGIGDSPSQQQPGRFDARAVTETVAAMDFLATRFGSRQFVLVGFCRGGTIAFQSALQDPRVSGVFLVNATIVREDTMVHTLRYAIAKTQLRFYATKVFSLKSWARFLLGKSDYTAIKSSVSRPLARMAGKGRDEPRDAATLEACRQLSSSGVRQALIFSEASPEWALLQLGIPGGSAALASLRELNIQVVPGADHVFTPLWAQAHLVKLLKEWLGAGFGTNRRPAGPIENGPREASLTRDERKPERFGVERGTDQP
jgi:pimeloyl-ACP methyl ester carboxylesterase